MTEDFLAGAILVDGSVLPKIRSFVEPADFQSENCRAIFTAACALLDSGAVIDPVSIREQARRSGKDLPTEYLGQLMAIIPSAANCEIYAHQLAEESRRRKIKSVAERISADTASTSDELLGILQHESESLRFNGTQNCILSPSDVLMRFCDHVARSEKGNIPCVASGYTGLDNLLGGGFQNGGLYILAARPAVGKSTFALNLADMLKGNCLFVSLEMTAEQLTAKRISRLTGLSPVQMLTGKIDDQGWAKIARASSALSEKGVFLNSRYDLTTADIQSAARMVPDLKAVFVDHLGLVQPETQGRSAYETVTKVSRGLKQMALALGVPVICLCQLSRTVESRENKRPRLSDLRDSGAIEQDADAVIFLYREDYYNQANADNGQPSLVEVNVAKNRHGTTGRQNFDFWMAMSAFREVTA